MTLRLLSRSRGPLKGVAPIPGDKSMSHRALILGAMAEGDTRISNLLESADIMATAAALLRFGIAVGRSGSDWGVQGGRWHSPDEPVDCGNSGTSARLLIGAVAGMGIEARFTGDNSLCRRPMRRLIEPLERMGARFSARDTLPLTVRGGGLGGIEHVNDPSSAQVKSAILLAGLEAKGPVTVIEPVPTRDHTEIMLRRFGCDIRSEGGRVILGERRNLTSAQIDIPGDPSSAAFALAAAALVPGSEVTIRDVLLNPHRSGFLMALQRMGADLMLDNIRGQGGETIGDVRVRHSPLFGAEFTPEEIPSMIDEIPALAIVAASARGETRIEGLGELRHKESDRLTAIADGLAACGIETGIEGDSLLIRGGRMAGGASIDVDRDHRIALAFAVLGLAAERPVEIRGAETIATSFPDFVQCLKSIGADIDELE